MSPPAKEVTPANVHIAITRNMSIISMFGIVMLSAPASAALYIYFLFEVLMKLLFCLWIAVDKRKGSGSDFRMSHLLPAIKTIVLICLEDFAASFYDRNYTGDKALSVAHS
jgi:hypothetical protein